MDTNERLLLQRSVNQNDRLISQNDQIIRQNASILDLLSRIGEASNSIASRSLDVFESLGKLATQVQTLTTQHGRNSSHEVNSGTIDSLRAEISRLKSGHASVRKKVDSVTNEWEEISSAELKSYRAKKKQVQEWVIRGILVILVIGVYTAIRAIVASNSIPGIK